MKCGLVQNRAASYTVSFVLTIQAWIPGSPPRFARLHPGMTRGLRFWNDDVLRDLNGVCDTIIAYVRDTSLQLWR